MHQAVGDSLRVHCGPTLAGWLIHGIERSLWLSRAWPLPCPSHLRTCPPFRRCRRALGSSPQSVDIVNDYAANELKLKLGRNHFLLRETPRSPPHRLMPSAFSWVTGILSLNGPVALRAQHRTAQHSSPVVPAITISTCLCTQNSTNSSIALV